MKTLFLGASNLLSLDPSKNVADRLSKQQEIKPKNLGFATLTTRMAGAGSCYPKGACTAETMVGNYKLYNKQYTIDDSIILRALSVYSAKMIEGGYITVINNVKDKQPLYRDEIRVRYKSTANGGKAGNACGPFDPDGAIDMITNKCIHTFFLYVETAICYKTLVGSFKQRLLKAGQLGSEDNDALNDRIIDETIKSNARQTDRLIWKGDYLSPIDDICHYDGIIKKTFNAIGAAVNHSVKLTFAGTLGATECFELQYGGAYAEFPFNTNTATTIGDVATALTALTHPTTLQPLLTVAFNGTDEITLVSNYSKLRIEFELQSTDCEGLACTGTGAVSIVKEELVVFKKSDTPMTIPFVPITVANVLDQLQQMYLIASSEHPDLTMQSDFYIHVSPYVWTCLKLASVKLTGNFKGIDSNGDGATPFGLKVVEQPGLAGIDAMLGTTTRNLFFGTDLESDMMNSEQWVNKECQEVRMRHESRQGVQVDLYGDIICNLESANFQFEAPQPEDCVAVGNC